LRDDGVVIAVNTREEGFAFFDGAQKIAAEFGLDGERSAPGIKIRDAFEFAESARSSVR
jgi:hypothetical protein